MKSNIHVISRGVLVNSKGLVLCQIKGSDWYFLPGGHVEDGEHARTALERELKEEFAEPNCTVKEFLGVNENTMLLEDMSSQHEVNLIFKVEIPENFKPESSEDELQFVQIPTSEVANYKILPGKLKDSLVKWLTSGSLFLDI